MRGELSSKVAVVTGASRRAGRATALALAREGAAVVLNARTAWAEISAVGAEITAAGGRALPYLADVTDEAAVAGMFAAAHSTFGRGADILVNNAAIRPLRPFADMSFAEWREVTGIILDGAFLCARAAVGSMVAQGGGVIINIGGISAHMGAAERAHVISAKMGLVGLTKALAVEFGPHNIRANCVVPGRIGGPRSATAHQPPPGGHILQPALQRDGRVEEVADVTLSLILSSGRYVTGQCLHVNGGLYLP